MSADKNHEKYLEEIETAVAETTKALMENEDYNLREAYRKIAEQDVEIKRLKEYQSNDRKTIRNLRKQLAEATEEVEKLFAENEKLTEKVDGYDCICKEYIGDTDEYISYERLRDYVDNLGDEIYAFECTVGDKDEENKKLKEECDYLEEKLVDIEDILDLNYGCESNFPPAERYTPCVKKVKELKEEIETLKQAERSQTKYWEGCIRTCEELNKAELDKYKGMVHNVWSELYWKDKYGEDVGWKDISHCVDYDEDYVKKEVVNDSDSDSD